MNVAMLNSVYSPKINFQGRNWNEKINNQLYVHETAFFREIDTDYFVKNYLFENYLSKNQPVNIVVGACSTGEEVYSTAMIYDDFKEQVNILGFDISEKAIEDCKKGVFVIHESPDEEFAKGYVPFSDSFLYYGYARDERKENLRKIFKKYFTTEGILQTPEHLIPKYVGGFADLSKKKCRLKQGVFKNCDFMQGDIKNLYFIKDESTDVFFFRNAMYHLVCNLGSARTIKKNDDEIIKNTIIEISKKLKPNGLLVFGEKEFDQGVDVKKVYEIMQECGFEPFNTQDRISKMPYCHLGYSKPHYTNVWRKVG